MPETTPEIKIDGVKKFGAKVILHGDDFSTAFARAQEIANENSLVFIPPFDDPFVIAGQGTMHSNFSVNIRKIFMRFLFQLVEAG